MDTAVPGSSLPRTLLTLGRVSNLPTVWSNVLAGTVLAGGSWQDWRFSAALAAMSAFYVGGMYLNDYCDRAIDAVERPARPIPSGRISPGAVATAALALLAAGVAAMASMGAAPALAGIALAGAIVVYDAFHKANPAAPLLMGLCRALVYWGAAAAAVGGVSSTLALAGVAMLAYVAGLTYAARQETLDRVGNLWPLLLLAAPLPLALPALGHGAAAAAACLALIGAGAYAVYLLWRRPYAGAVPQAVGWLIAGISLVDSALLAAAGATGPAVAAACGFILTLVLQRHIAGT